MHFSKRISQLEINSLTQAVQRAYEAGIEVQNISDSNPTRHALAPAGVPGPYVADPRGPFRARRQLAAFLSAQQGREVNPENLYLLSSTSQAYSWLLKLFCDPGESIFAPCPGYPLIEQLAALEGARQKKYFLHFAGQWFIDTAELHQQLAAAAPELRPRALAVINPNNPTGSYLYGGERAEILEICRRYNLPLIADEVFFSYSLGAEAELQAGGARRFAGEKSVLTLALDGFSKNLGAPQAKLAWIEVSGPTDLVAAAQARLDIIADAYLPMSTLITEQLPELLAEIPAQIDRIRARTRTNLATLQRLVTSSRQKSLSIYLPEGGWSALFRFPSYLDEAELVQELIRRANLTAQPGYFFDLPTPGFLNISLLPDPEVFTSNLQQVVAIIDDLLS